MQGPPVFITVSFGHFGRLFGVQGLDFVGHFALYVGRNFLEDELFHESSRLMRSSRLKKEDSSGFLVGRRSSASYVAAVAAAVALLAAVA